MLHVQKPAAFFFFLRSLTLIREKKGSGDLGHIPKIALLRVGGFALKSFGEEVVEGKKILFHISF